MNIRATIEAVFEEELEQFFDRCRHRQAAYIIVLTNSTPTAQP